MHDIEGKPATAALGLLAACLPGPDASERRIFGFRKQTEQKALATARKRGASLDSSDALLLAAVEGPPNKQPVGPWPCRQRRLPSSSSAPDNNIGISYASCSKAKFLP